MRGAEKRDAFIGISLDDGRELWSMPNHVPYLPGISADSRYVAFSENGTILVFDVGARRLTTLPVRGRNVDWDAGGSRLAFDDDIPGEDTRGTVSIFDFSRNAASVIGPGRNPSWVPGSMDIAVRNRQAIELVNVDTRNDGRFFRATAPCRRGLPTAVGWLTRVVVEHRRRSSAAWWNPKRSS